MLVVGALLARQLPVSTIFLLIGLPGILAAVTGALVGIRYSRDERTPAGASLALSPSR